MKEIPLPSCHTVTICYMLIFVDVCFLEEMYEKKLLKTESKNKKCECELTIYIYYSTHFTLELVAIHTATKTADTKKLYKTHYTK
jgi:hypothetical protein